MTIIEDISIIIKDYGARSTSMSIDDVLEAADLLATSSYHLAEMVNNARREWVGWELKKDRVRKVGWKPYADEMGITRAMKEAEANAFTDGLMDEEADSKEYFQSLKLLLDQANNVLDIMRSRISYLKMEKNGSGMHQV